MWILDVVTLVVAVAAAGVAVVALRRQAGPRRTTGAEALPEDVLGLRQEVAALRAEAGDSLRHLAVVRYDAFGDMGGHLSWSLALLDNAGNGVVLTSIHGRSEARTYAKNVTDWSSQQQLSPEEEEADRARPTGVTATRVRSGVSRRRWRASSTAGPDPARLLDRGVPSVDEVALPSPPMEEVALPQPSVDEVALPSPAG